MSNFEKDIEEILTHLEKTLISKNKDYGNSFDEQMDEFGLKAGAIRISDKFKRMKQLISNEANVKGEALEDTMLDLAGYSVLFYRYLTKVNDNKWL